MRPGFFLTAAGCSYGGQRFDVSFEAGSDALAQLQAIIAEADVASCNGINVQTMGVPECGGSISVKCASGERIYARVGFFPEGVAFFRRNAMILSAEESTLRFLRAAAAAQCRQKDLPFHGIDSPLPSAPSSV